MMDVRCVKCGLFAALLLLANIDATADMPEAPITFRLQEMARRLDKLQKTDNSVVVQRLQKDHFQYVISWCTPKSIDESDNGLTCDAVVKICGDFLNEKLPSGLLPQKSKLICISKLQLNPNSVHPHWIWIAEFNVEDETPVFGMGYRKTLPVLIAGSGKVLMEIVKTEALW